MRPAMQPVSSSMIKSVGYDADTQKLHVQFKSGKTREYDDVPEADFEGFTSGSAGQHFLSNIKSSYDGREV